jgi:hypothetical protein
MEREKMKNIVILNLAVAVAYFAWTAHNRRDVSQLFANYIRNESQTAHSLCEALVEARPAYSGVCRDIEQVNQKAKGLLVEGGF